MKLRFVILVFLSFFSLVVVAQKIERESRINEGEVPRQSVEWMEDAFEGVRKIEWYREESSRSGGDEMIKSYEAKVDWKSKYHSVEFDKDGNIEDIEIIFSWKELPKQVRGNLEEYFNTNYEKYKIQKIQIQYTGSSDNLEDIIDEEEFDDVTTRYEIEYYGNNTEGKLLWEGLFDEEGKFIQKSRIVQRPTDNLNY